MEIADVVFCREAYTAHVGYPEGGTRFYYRMKPAIQMFEPGPTTEKG